MFDTHYEHQTRLLLSLLPALQWKLQNTRKMDPAKKREMLGRLGRVLDR